MKIDSFPKNDGFFMPAEFEPHEATIMIFPERPGSWPYRAKRAGEVFSKIIRKISECEKVYVVVSKETKDRAKEMLGDLSSVYFLEIPTDDAWARDTAPTFVKNDKGLVRGISWRFNAWGGEVDGLYRHFEKDDALAVSFCDAAGFDHYDAGDFVLEGGSIHSNGKGTLLVTESCLLSKGRIILISSIHNYCCEFAFFCQFSNFKSGLTITVSGCLICYALNLKSEFNFLHYLILVTL